MARIRGTTGDDDLVGRSFDDVFVFADDHGDDTITDFADGKDLIDLMAVSGISRFEDLTITQDGDDVLIDTGEGTIRLKNFSIDDLDARDFKFRIDGDSGDNTLRGGDGSDTIYGHGGDDTLYGGAGEDFLYGGGGDDTIYGGAGDDWVRGGDGNDTLHGGAGDDRIAGGAGDDTLYGGEGDDFLSAGPGTDTLYGGAGKDIFAFWGAYGHGNHTIKDFVSGEDKIDLVALGARWANSVSRFEDLTITQDGSDTVIDTGRGTIRVENFNADDLDAGDFVFRVYGTTGDDTIHGDDGQDLISGDQGDDTLYGGAGDDKLWGEEGDDTLYGGAGDDLLVGFSGNDTFHGGAGDDTFYAGGYNDGNDTFVFGSHHGNDTIVGFADGRDTIDLSATGLTDFADLTITQVGNDVIVDTGGDATGAGGYGTIRLKNFNIDDLDADDFLFADPPVPTVLSDEL